MHHTLFPSTIERYKDKVRFIYKDNPLVEIHPWATHAAVDANCLGAQNNDLYWTYVDYIHSHGQEVNGEDRDAAKASAALDRIARQQATLAKLDPGRLMDLFADTSGGTNVIKMRGPAVATMLKGGDPGPVGFPVDGGLKDLRTMLAEGKARGLELPLVERTLACFLRASRDGWGGRDAASMPVYWTQRAAT